MFESPPIFGASITGETHKVFLSHDKRRIVYWIPWVACTYHAETLNALGVRGARYPLLSSLGAGSVSGAQRCEHAIELDLDT